MMKQEGLAECMNKPSKHPKKHQTALMHGMECHNWSQFLIFIFKQESGWDHKRQKTPQTLIHSHLYSGYPHSFFSNSTQVNPIQSLTFLKNNNKFSFPAQFWIPAVPSFFFFFYIYIKNTLLLCGPLTLFPCLENETRPPDQTPDQ